MYPLRNGCEVGHRLNKMPVFIGCLPIFNLALLHLRGGCEVDLLGCEVGQTPCEVRLHPLQQSCGLSRGEHWLRFRSFCLHLARRFYSRDAFEKFDPCLPFADFFFLCYELEERG